MTGLAEAKPPGSADTEVSGECSQGLGCASPGAAQWDGVQGEQLIVYPGSRWAAEHTGGCSTGFISHPSFFGWSGIILKPLLWAWLRQVWVPQLPDPAGLWWRKSAQTAPEPQVINTEIGGQGCSALPEQAARVRLEWSRHRKQHREVVGPAWLDLFQ